ncbi:MAG: signal peptidase I [Planctomycetes bacterium]|nr:signal peptidase I [Planctomycetota bacterium]
MPDKDSGPSHDSSEATPAEDRKAAKQRRKAKNALQTPKRGFFRSNLEAFTVAIVMALVIKTYAFEAFQVPTESMEPTIIGRTPGGDRIIVNKFVYEFRDPRRFEIVVFRYPLSRMVNYVKRLVGLPGEVLKIAHGDLYVSRDGGQFAVARKSPQLADAIFEENPVIPEDVIDQIESNGFREWWELPSASRSHIDNEAGVLELDAGNASLMVATRKPINPERRDQYAKDRAGKGDAQQKGAVGDLRVDLEVTPESGCDGVVIKIQDGTQPNLEIKLVLGVEGGAASKLTHGKIEVGNADLKKVALEKGEEVTIRLENYDDRIRVEVDGDEICTYEYVQAWREAPSPGVSQVSFGLTGGKASFSKVGVWRDLYYTLYSPTQTDFTIPDGHYLFCGDNSANSLDARGWRVVGIRRRSDGRVLLGDLEAVSDSFDWPRRDNNPYFETEKITRDGRIVAGEITDDTPHFLDIHGNEWDLDSGDFDVIDLTKFGIPQGDPRILDLHGQERESLDEKQIAVPKITVSKLKALTSHTQHSFFNYSLLMHYVPRDDIMGQANLIFWPPSRIGVIR